MSEHQIPFGLEVKLTDKGWKVRLPHQCDLWDIVGEDCDGATHGEAVAELERFIAEAHEALGHLMAGRQIAYDWKFGDPTPTKVIS